MIKENRKVNSSSKIESLYRGQGNKSPSLRSDANNNTSRNKSELFFEDFDNNITKYLPPENSLSQLVVEENLEALKEKIVLGNMNLNQRDDNGNTASWTPLYWAVKYDKIECVKILLEHGADINVIINDPDECCGTVLDLAVLRNNQEMENLLRDYATKEEINFGQSFKAIRTKLRGKSLAFNFKNYSKKNIEDNK